MATETRVRPAPARRRAGRPSLLWWMTSLSGVALVVLLGAHMIANHFVIHRVGGLRTYHEVLEYISDPVIFSIESLFLVVVTIHAMLGLRSVLFDLTDDDTIRRRIEWGLRALGVATLAYGFFLIGTLASRA
jgi:succinate dehydrogenase hydrophobic anchor subunit